MLSNSLGRHTKSCCDEDDRGMDTACDTAIELNDDDMIEGNDREDLPTESLVDNLLLDCISNSINKK